MDEFRHVVVEKPDGSVAIAFNQEVPPPEPPEPPPEIIQPRFRLLLEYHPVARALAYQFSIAMMCITAFNTCNQTLEQIPI